VTYVKNVHERLVFRFGRQTGIRSASDVVEQLQEQFESERKKCRQQLSTFWKWKSN
jgi:hypothetical protein